jgi:hypothetical protein
MCRACWPLCMAAVCSWSTQQELLGRHWHDRLAAVMCDWPVTTLLHQSYVSRAVTGAVQCSAVHVVSHCGGQIH